MHTHPFWLIWQHWKVDWLFGYPWSLLLREGALRPRHYSRPSPFELWWQTTSEYWSNRSFVDLQLSHKPGLMVANYMAIYQINTLCFVMTPLMRLHPAGLC